MQSNYQYNINNALKELHDTKSISSALLVCNTLLEYMGIETKPVEDIELSKLKLPNAERYDRWFDAHPHFRGDRACFDIIPQTSLLEAKFFALQKRSKLFIAGAVSFTPNFEDRDYTRNDPDMKVGVDFFLTPEKDSVVVVLSNKGSLRLVELSGRLTNTQIDIFSLWHNVAEITDKNIFHTTIWESFKLSSLNKKFYEGIANSFLSLTQHLQNNDVEEQLSNQFANRLHGRLLFLWFLRKKNIINESKEYFTLGDNTDTEYYTNKLSTLFFNVLNNEDHKDFDPITPYLNGGLFDQNSDGEYWSTNKPTFPRGFFRTLYDHFDSFNFTTDESTPEYEQIAIDPEMLGRIFESFLATLTTETGAQAKKANGAFYTPREIVSYMSRESLRQYLYTALDASTTLKTSIDDLLDRPDNEWALAGTNSKRDTVAKEDREKILEALRNIKVLDPAVGSGAFPMGILHKILSLFERLEPNFDSYETKLSILKNNIYGVDIDPTAIEISRLRAWLSIIVDVKDIKKIKPLPNLDFKFVCANSLLSLDSGEGNIFKDIEDNVISQLSTLFGNYYNESKKKAKEKLKNDIATVLQHSKVFLQAGSSFKKAFETYNPFNTGNVAQFYNPKIMHGVEAFDVTIGNPPYVQLQKFARTQIQKDLENQNYKTFTKNADLYCLFYEQAIKLLKHKGVLVFITSNKWMRSGYGEKLRQYFIEQANPKILIDFAGFKVFESATVDTNILLIEKGSNKKSLQAVHFKNDYKKGDSIPEYIKNHSILLSEINKDSWFIGGAVEINLKNKIELSGKTLEDWGLKISRGIVSGLKNTFEVDNNFYNHAIKTDPSYKEAIKPILHGREISSYEINSRNSFLIFALRGFKLDAFPLIKKHLSENRDLLEDRATIDSHPWYELQQPQMGIYKDFEKERIVYPDISQESAFALCPAGMYQDNTTYSIDTNSRYILGLLNSKLISYYYRFIANTMGEKTVRYFTQYVEKLPIVKLDDNNPIKIKIESLVDKIISVKKADSGSNTKDLEDQIDTLVYKLYDLNDAEIKVIEGQK